MSHPTTRRAAASSFQSAARRVTAALAALVLLSQAPGAIGQEGHPLKGSWLGVWSGNEIHGENVLLVLDWDGKNITGIINPGTDNIGITRASLDPEGWKVTIEADAKDASGAAVRYVIEGRIENLELPNRSIVGTWRTQGARGAFEASRQ